MNIDFQPIRQYVENMEYGWTKPQTYLLLVPGLASIIQKIKLAKISPLTKVDIKSNTNEEIHQADTKSRQFVDIFKWQNRTTFIRLAACCAIALAVQVFALPLFIYYIALFCAVVDAMIVLQDLLGKNGRHLKFFEFDAEGKCIREVDKGFII